MVVVDPCTFPKRSRKVGFDDVQVDVLKPDAFRFRTRKAIVAVPARDEDLGVQSACRSASIRNGASANRRTPFLDRVRSLSGLRIFHPRALPFHMVTAESTGDAR
jgi:hypothetical protein